MLKHLSYVLLGVCGTGLIGLLLAPPSALAGNKPAPTPAGLTNPAIAFTGSGASCPISIAKADGTCLQLTKPPSRGGDFGPAWSPDGKRIAFLHFADTALNTRTSLWIMNADGTNQHVLIGEQDWAFDYDIIQSQLHWSSDGEFLLCGEYVVDMTYGQWAPLSDFFGGGLPGVEFVAHEFNFGPDLDPDTPGFQGYLICNAYWDNGDGTYGGGSLALLQADMFNDGSGMQIDLGLAAVCTEKENLNLNPVITHVHPALSPDGTVVVYRNGYAPCGCYLKTVDIVSDNAGNLAFGEPRVLCDWRESPYPHTSNDYGIGGSPAWSPDGSYIAFTAMSVTLKNSAAPLFDVYCIRPDGTGLSPITSVTDRAGVSPYGSPAWNPVWDPRKP